MKLIGKVVERSFGVRSKSAHDAVYLETAEGDYVLRKAGANPFDNDELRRLIGKEVEVTGTVKEYLFIAKLIKEV